MNRLRRQASCQQASRSSTPSSREGLDALEAKTRVEIVEKSLAGKERQGLDE